MITFSYHQKGLSLIELLIAMLLGLILMAGALQMMLSSQEIYKTTDTLSRIQENGRFALNFLAKDIRMAGYETSIEANGDVFMGGGCAACSTNGTGNASDQISILMDPSNNLDCQGTSVSAEKVIVNVYSIADLDNNQVSSLYCRGYNYSASAWMGSSAQPLVDGVENMQILYGISDPDAENAIIKYVSAGNITDWGAIGAVRVSLLLNNGQSVGNSNNEARTFNLLDADQITITDKHSRQVFSTTVAINNVIYQSSNL